MRLLFLFYSLLPLTSFCQQDSVNVYDTLGKYSYLLIGAISPPARYNFPAGQIALTGNATGFFIRQNGKLYLVSAFHVFTGCDVYNVVFENLINQFLIVPYRDTLGNMKSVTLTLNGFKDKPCKLFLDAPDVDVMDVSYTFKDGNINSIESMLPEKIKSKKFIDANRYISYGFPGDRFQAYIYKNMDINEGPNFYHGEIADSSQYDPYYNREKLDSMCISIKPALFSGTSGSPIFKILENKKKKKEIIIFAGIQSGTNFKYNCSYMVKEEKLVTILNQLK